MGYGEVSVKSNVLNEGVSLKQNFVCLREETVPSLWRKKQVDCLKDYRHTQAHLLRTSER